MSLLMPLIDFKRFLKVANRWSARVNPKQNDLEVMREIYKKLPKSSKSSKSCPVVTCPSSASKYAYRSFTTDSSYKSYEILFD